jgi:DNA-binding HxlR family transcriptional regulator
LESPFWSQRRTKSANRSRILRLLSEKARTFGELQEAVHLSKPVLSIHLRELQDEGLIARQVRGRRIEYALTAQGKGMERLRIESIKSGLDVLRQLALDPSIADTLSEMNKLAKDDPELFEELMQWIGDFMLTWTSDDMLSFSTRHPGKEGRRILKEGMAGKMPVLKKLSESENPFEAMSMTLKAMREIVAADRRNRGSA